MKIVSAANAMILNPDKITSVIPSINGNEFFFMYDGKYKWSISSFDNGSQYSLYYYPTDLSLEDLSVMGADDWEDFPYLVRYSAKDIGTREAKETFAELYRVVKEQLFGLNQVLSDIISTANWGANS